MTLHLYNTASGQKEIFEPVLPGQVSMYVCGPTVYNRIHIGNARPAVVFDVLFRLLQTLYSKVEYARNITDIDDKIMNAAAELGEDISVISSRFAQAYFDDVAELGNVEPTIIPYATDHIAEMQAMIGRLIAKGFAYEAQGHVLFAVQQMADYGALSNRSLDDMLAGARVEVAPYKKYAGDFVLWKPSTELEPGWDSPWGRGRPGWHIECSAMIQKHLGSTIDIHGGGRDLIFPHHENERAQSCCANDGAPFVRFWMHNGYINIDGEKMSKSLGNFTLVRDLLGHYPGEVLRFALLSAHYRSELNFSAELLDQAKSSLDTLYGFLRNAADEPADAAVTLAGSSVYQALLDDLNTPIAISELYSLARAMNKAEGADKAALKSQLLASAAVMGLLQANPEAWFQGGAGELDAAAIEALIQERLQARANKDYARSDEIRDSLKAQGVILQDGREGTTWRRE